MDNQAAVLYGALFSRLCAVCLGLPPWVSQYAEPATRSDLHRKDSQVLFFGNVGIYFDILGFVLG